MTRRLITLLVLVPIGIMLIVFSVANRQPVRLSFNPFNPAEEFLAYNVPLFALLFAALLIGMVIGSMATWVKQGKHRKKAREKSVEATKWHFEADKEKERAEKLAQEVVSGAPDSRPPTGISAGALPSPSKG